MGREQELERQLKELREAKNRVLGKLDDAIRLPDTHKKTMWDAIAPHVRTAVDNRTKDPQSWNWPELRDLIAAKAMEALLGGSWKEDLEKL